MENECCKKTSVTEECVESAIQSEEYLTVGKKTTVCVLTLKNGFEVVGTSACVDVNNYSQEVGQPYARKKAIDQVWTHLASILQAELNQRCCNEVVSEALAPQEVA